MNLTQPVRLGKYLLLDKIATGGMAELYRAKIIGVQGFEKLIAIKKILPHLAGEEELVKSFIDEAKLAALLQNQNIVQIYDFGNLDGSYFIAMEYLLGKDLRSIVNKSKEKGMPLSLENSLHVISRVCAGLDYAHNLKDYQGKPLNIIHRDISPQNIFVTYEGDVKIVDFGIARAATQSTLTQVGMIKGKVAYMSPEQAKGEHIDHRSDIFATGIVLYELATHKRMFQGETLKILSLVRNAEYESPESAARDLPAKLLGILHKALEKDSGQRYQSCGEMLADLEECVYQLSMRPTARGLSEYMKTLFAEEMAAEQNCLKRLLPAAAPEVKELERETPTVKEIRQKEPPAAPAPKPQEKKKSNIVWYGAGAAIVASILIIFSLVSKEKPAPIPEKKTAPEKKIVETVKIPAAQKPAKPSFKPGQAGFEAGLRALEKENFAEAVAAFEKALSQDSSLKQKIDKPYARALQGQALDLASKHPEKAKEILLKSLALDPASVQANFQLGLVYVKLKEYLKAIETYQKVTKLDPRFPDAYFNLGYAFAVTKDYTRAEESYGRVVQLSPAYLDEALFNLAIVQEKLGKRVEALSNLEKAVKINPNNKQARNALKHLKGK